ncbi:MULTISPECIES: CocE/NonD family hydrolase [unclassified Halorhodospira]|uniref:CocE/NonD family hydrolase n=1 Tax=unclassified Halorhodospira TaxID=2626748 RepID=UPI001EE9AE77|nr:MULTISPECIES: CocE/NonD family hydrolase [unclassified Halorhodospira]MCG5539582.1 CocE/NonD family hydrolase [Halorhodospira sp. M39old]MCG5545392.1 CocE/NonD family hydrolase [Halorhodospira sp. M38]
MAARAVHELPNEVEVVEHQWITMRDGTRLSARIWKPAGAERNPVPAVLEFIPYRKRDIKRMRDTQIHHYFAAHGHAGVRVDLRGSGDSEGVLTDEYLLQEQEDAEDILRWLAEQPWCTGDVGMMGISWGGFNALQVAARRPPQLKAVIAVAATDDRYADDVHYKGGCLLNDNLSWASVMFAFNSMPPDPKIVGDRWREMWMQRLEDSGLWVKRWMSHPQRDDYWRHGSVCEDYSAIQVPVMIVSGWADGYPNPVFRLVENLQAPCKGLVGPWSHIYPHMGLPGPQIGFLQEALRWWDQWLRGEERGLLEEPRLRVWMQDSVRPRTQYASRPGRWVAEPGWPSPNIDWTRLQLSPRHMQWPGEPPPETDAGKPVAIQSPLSLGLFGGKWCSYNNGPDLPYDQREEDGGALIFDTQPLEEAVEILGAPVVELDLESSRPVAQIAVRLSDEAPDGKATRVTYGVLNLCHRNGHDQPAYLEPGSRERIRVPLDHIAQSFPRGHRIRLAVSTSYWPLAWPPPQPVRLTLYPEGCHLDLPVRPPREEDRGLPAFDEAEAAPPPASTALEHGHGNWIVSRDLARDESTLHVIEDDGRAYLEDVDLEVERSADEWYRARGDDFTSLSGEVIHRRRLRRGDWSIYTETRTLLTCDEGHFRIHATLDAYENGLRVFAKTWDERVPRAFL